MNIGQAIARRIDRARRRLPGHIDPERVGSAETRPLADQYSRERGAKNATNLVPDRDAAPFDDCGGAQPKRCAQPGGGGPPQRPGGRLDSRGGKALGNHKKKIDCRCGGNSYAVAPFWVEPPPPIAAAR